MAGRSHPAALANAREASPGLCHGDAPVGRSQTAIGIAERERQPKPVTGRSGAVDTSGLLPEVVGHGSHASSIAPRPGREARPHVSGKATGPSPGRGWRKSRGNSTSDVLPRELTMFGAHEHARDCASEDEPAGGEDAQQTV